MPKINISKCFHNSFKPLIPTHTNIPNDWLNFLGNTWAELLNYCGQDKVDFLLHLTRHCRTDSNYLYKDNLLEGLKSFYLCLTDNTTRQFSSQEKKLMLLSLSSDIDACTPGFHNRVNQTQILLHTPYTIERFLYLIRTNLVDKLARSLSSDVHVHNKVFLIASDKFGVNVPNINDPFINSITQPSSGHISESLELYMNCYFQPFQIIESLSQLIKDTLSNNYAYCGQTTDGYTREVYLGIVYYLEKLFELESISIYEYFLCDEERIIDINWNRLKLSLFQYLQQHQYIDFDEYETTIFKQLMTDNHLPLIDIAKLKSMFPNHQEFLVFLFLCNTADFSSKFQILLDYICLQTIASRFAFTNEALIMAETEFYAQLIEMIYQINQIIYLPKFLMQEDFKDQNIILQNIQSNKHFKVSLHLLSMLNEEDYQLFIQWTNSQNYNVLMLAVKQGKPMVKALLENIKTHTNESILFNLLRQSNEANQNSLMIALQTNNLSYQTILAYIACYSLDKKEILLSKRDTDGTNILMLALRANQLCFNEILNFIEIHLPAYLPEFIMTPNAMGQNLISFSFTHPNINISILFDKIKHLSYRQKILLLEQNNSHSENLLMQSAHKNSSCFKTLLELVISLESLDGFDILKKKNLFGNTIFDCLIEGKSSEILYFLNQIRTHHPILIAHFFHNNSAQFSGTLIHIIKHYSEFLPFFLEQMNELSIETQFEIMTQTSIELQEGALIHVLNYADNYLPLVFNTLLSLRGLDFSVQITEFFCYELIGIISDHQHAAKLLSCLLHCYNSIHHNLIEEVCTFISYLNKTEFISISAHLASIINLLILEEFNTPKLLEFLSQFFLKSYNIADDRVEIAVVSILKALNSDHHQSQYLKIIKHMFKMGYLLEEPQFKHVIEYVKQQPKEFQKAFLLDADNAGNTTLSAYILHLDSHIINFLDWLLSLEEELQYVVWTQRNVEGKNFFQLMIENFNTPTIQRFYTHITEKLNLLSVRIKYQLYRMLTQYPNSNILFSAVLSAPSKLPELLKEISQYDYYQILMTQVNLKGYNLLLLAVEHNIAKLDVLVDYIKILPLQTQFEMLKQTCQSKPSENFTDKTIFDVLLPQTNSQLNIILDLVKNLSLHQQQTILNKTHFLQITGIEGHTLELFKTYKKGVEHALSPSFFNYKRIREDDTSMTKFKNKP